MDRRGRDRCPVCQGPMREIDSEELRCRNSICSYNHRRQACPRCKHVGAQVSLFEEDIYYYICKECQHTWKQPVAFIERT